MGILFQSLCDMARELGEIECTMEQGHGVEAKKDLIRITENSLTPKRRHKRRASSSPKKVRLNTKVYLKHEWTMWYAHAKNHDSTQTEKIGTFATVQTFWRYYNQLVDPSKFPHKTNLSVFKIDATTGADTPAAPSSACKWTIPCSKTDTGKVWMKILLALIGEQFTHSSLITGAVLAVRPVMDNVILWGNQANIEQVEAVTTQVRKLVENDTNHLLSFSRVSVDDAFSPTANLSSPMRADPVMSNSRKFVSTNDLAAEEKEVAAKHKKSSSFSDSQFPDMMSSAFKKHRKSRSESERKGSSTRKSLSYSTDSQAHPRSMLSNQRTSLIAQMYNNTGDPKPFQISRDLRTAVPKPVDAAPVPVVAPKTEEGSSFNTYRALSLFVLFLLILSGFLFTPK